VILGYVSGGIAALYDSGVLITLSNGVPVMSPTDKEHIVYRFLNDFQHRRLSMGSNRVKPMPLVLKMSCRSSSRVSSQSV
jgi:hypothetical protein